MNARDQAGPPWSGFDFFRGQFLGAPTLSHDEIDSLLRTHFGVSGPSRELGSQQDQTFLLQTADLEDTEYAVVKISNPAFDMTEVEAQDEAADMVAGFRPGLAVASVLRRDGIAMREAVQTSQGRLVMRLTRFLPNGTLADRGYLSPTAVRSMGKVAAEVSLALATYSHPGLNRTLQWDLQHADRAVEHLAASVGDSAARTRLRRAAETSWASIRDLTHALPRQAGHFDLTDDNLISAPTGPEVGGVIDFGDATTSWAVAELAVNVSSVLHHSRCEPSSVLPAVVAFDQLRPLSDVEVTALWPLVVMRTAVLVASGHQQVAVDPGNLHARASLEREWQMFASALSIPEIVMTEQIRIALGRQGAPAPAAAGCAILGADVSPVLLDLSPQSDAADGGAWLDEDFEQRAVADNLAPASTVVLPFGAPRMGQQREPESTSAATIATAASLYTSQDLDIFSPWDGAVSGSDTLIVTAGDHRLVVHGAQTSTSGEVRAGTAVAHCPAGGRLEVQVLHATAPDVPPLVRPEYAAGWLALVRDPADLLGVPAVGEEPTAADLMDKRDLVVASVQEHYYDAPPRVERGWRHFLVSSESRVYLDMVNNVACVGHAHPRLTSAIARQLRRLNTNSRFHYASMVRFAEKIAALLPDMLDTVFLVNSGSEAVDLSIRIAMAATGRSDIVAVQEAYHGWTYASDAVSTSVADNPAALDTRPRWVHLVDPPNSYRGRHRDADAWRYGPEAAQRVRELAEQGAPPAAFVAETFYGNAGGVPLPEGYLEHVYTAVREVGGLAVADEVQVGYGRLGHWFWGFEQQRVIPDIVATAKAAGNGFPLGVVVTTSHIADAYRSQGSFFSSTGGSTLSCVVGSTVLDIIEAEGLQENARYVGAVMKQRLEELSRKHPLIGAVHGHGLYIGVELVADPVTRAPATSAAQAICDRLLELGVVTRPTGDHMNVLKVKPPLCIDEASVHFFVNALDEVLTHGW